MNKIEKISVARVFSDLIKADSVIDCREMELFNMLKKEYRLNNDCLRDARYTTFADAVNNLTCLHPIDKSKLMEHFRRITLADGMCNKDEALLMIALIYCLENDDDSCMLHVQVPQQGLQLKNSQVIYVESKYDTVINQVLTDNYQQIENAMRLAGFEFAYIPQIAKTYKETPDDLMCDVLTFLNPSLDKKELQRIHQQVSTLTTIQFSTEQLSRKLHLTGLADTYPALLVKVGETVCEDKIFANFLKIEIEGDVLEYIKHFIYLFTSMMNAEYTIVRNVYNDNQRFIYSGVYKQIMDLCLMKESTKSVLLIDTMKQKVLLPDIHEELDGKPAELALYVLILIESLTGGLCMPKPGPKQADKEKHLMAKYDKIYRNLGGDQVNTPNIIKHTIRAPKVSHINTFIGSLGKKLSHPEEYVIQRSNDGLYRIGLDRNLIFIIDNDGEKTPWMQSDTWRRIASM